MLRSLRITNLVLIQEAELELSPGLNAITGETGAGKTILTNAIGLLLGGKGDAALIGAAGEEAYVEAELDGIDDDALGPLAELRPDGEEGVVLARRIFKDGRTRAYAWGRSAAREDVAAAAEAAIAMSGQFEQRRLARPAYQRSVLDAFAGLDLRPAQQAWRELLAARRAHEALTSDAAAAQLRLDELRALAEDTEGLEPGREDELRTDRERLRHVGELADGASRAAGALASDEGEGATDLVAAAERAVAPLERLAPELQAAGDALRSAELQLRETASELRSFLLTLEAEPGGSRRSSRSSTDLPTCGAATGRTPSPSSSRAVWRRGSSWRPSGRATTRSRRPSRHWRSPKQRWRGYTQSSRPRAALPPSRSQRRSPASCSRSAWATASSGSSSESASRARQAPTRWDS